MNSASAEPVGALSRLLAPWFLRHVTATGDDLRIVGRPVIRSEGTIRIGAGVSLINAPQPIRIIVGQRGSLEIDDGVQIAAGAIVVARGQVQIERGARIGAGVRLLDDDSESGIRIREGARIEAGATLLAGADVGPSARVLRGAVVSGHVPEGAVVSATGIEPRHEKPEAQNGRAALDSRSQIQSAVRAVLAERVPAASTVGPADDLQEIAGFDSLALVHWIVALEARFGMPISPEALSQARTLEDVVALVDSGREQPATASSVSAWRVPADASPFALGVQGAQSRASGETTARTSTVAGLLSAMFLALANVLPLWRAGRLRTQLFRLAGCRIARGSHMLGPVSLVGVGLAARRLIVGTGSIIAHEVTFGLDAEIRIGRQVSLGPYCRLYTATHHIGRPSRRMDPNVWPRAIVVEDGVWVGMGSLILPGVRLGAGCVVAAGSVVTHDVPPNALVSGNPAALVQQLGDG